MLDSSKKILCTKRLNETQLSQLSNVFAINHFDIIETTMLHVDFSEFAENIIFTSYKAANFGLTLLGEDAVGKNFFCVGQKTKELLNMLELDTRSCESYSKDLANHIIDGYSSESFSYLCNENRMDELPSMLKTANVDCKEYITYQSNVIDFSDIDVYDNDIYMWFSPMGVKALANKILKEGVFHYAIGETTAKELMKENINSEQIFYPTIPSVDGMIELINNRHK